jgi:hypothetical protein
VFWSPVGSSCAICGGGSRTGRVLYPKTFPFSPASYHSSNDLYPIITKLRQRSPSQAAVPTDSAASVQ